MEHSNRRIILIAGGSCSGKTILAKGLERELGSHGSVRLISIDNYYYDLSDWDPVEADNKNFDSPDSINFELLNQHLESLIAGKPIPNQLYDFKYHTVFQDGQLIHSADFLLVEGIFALHYMALRDLASISIFMSINDELRYGRRMQRDTTERRLPVELVERQFSEDVRPMHNRYVEPTAFFADLVLDSGIDCPDKKLSDSMDFILTAIK
ncbi:MAG: uridine kinase [Lentisphaerae bacterium]|nr:uridine kinase [Lentisphaerota bacterium]MCP4103600.1 uridine kinase [Lentisphaerota bacterium]